MDGPGAFDGAGAVSGVDCLAPGRRGKIRSGWWLLVNDGLVADLQGFAGCGKVRGRTGEEKPIPTFGFGGEKREERLEVADLE